MGIEYFFLFGCLGALVLITLGLVFNTCISGSKYFKTFQFLMSALQYSSHAEKTITLLLDKMEANLLIAKIYPYTDTIVFIDTETFTENCGEIFVGSKYYAYGHLTTYYGKVDSSLYRKRPKIKTLKRIIELENKLRNAGTDNEAPPKDKRNSKKVVEL